MSCFVLTAMLFLVVSASVVHASRWISPISPIRLPAPAPGPIARSDGGERDADNVDLGPIADAPWPLQASLLDSSIYSSGPVSSQFLSSKLAQADESGAAAQAADELLQTLFESSDINSPSTAPIPPLFPFVVEIDQADGPAASSPTSEPFAIVAASV